MTLTHHRRLSVWITLGQVQQWEMFVRLPGDCLGLSVCRYLPGLDLQQAMEVLRKSWRGDVMGQASCYRLRSSLQSNFSRSIYADTCMAERSSGAFNGLLSPVFTSYTCCYEVSTRLLLSADLTCHHVKRPLVAKLSLKLVDCVDRLVSSRIACATYRQLGCSTNFTTGTCWYLLEMQSVSVCRG